MMIEIRRAADRGRTETGWLDSRHSFSFGHYRDPDHMGFGVLRVINEDRVIPGAGFATHSHQDMEILSYVLAGALEHKDSLGTGSVIRPGDIQRMSAGTGITHSEFNQSRDEPVHFLQIWLIPDRAGIKPGYEQKTLDLGGMKNALTLAAAPKDEGGAVTIHQDARMYAALLEDGSVVDHRLGEGRAAWIQITRGSATVQGEAVRAGDGVAVTGKPDLRIAGDPVTEILLFDLPAD